MRVFSKLAKELFFGGLSREEFYQVKNPVAETNQKTLVAWSISVGLFWAMSLLMSINSEGYTSCRTVYIIALSVSVFTLICALFLVGRLPWILSLAMYLLELSFLGAGIGIAFFQPDVRTVTLIAVAIIIPSCFIDRTIIAIIQLLITAIVYAGPGKTILDPGIYSWGLLNLIIFSVAGILIGHTINKARFERYVYADSSKKLAEMQANYNAELQKEVEAKTEQILTLQDKLVIGMATMVESRDNSTGGHIRRTSTGVKILAETILEDGSLRLSEDFCEKIIKAAPMHDLGKITVDDAILRKPGKYTSEEFEEMKTHAAEGARIIHDILIDAEDEDFRRIAENIAHYHHERVDGSGYPDGLKGDAIPLEAKIMAIADVYDALVSKRPYKERYSFEKANRLILEGMGTHFDPLLRKYYEAARPKLEAYYAAELKDE